MIQYLFTGFVVHVKRDFERKKDFRTRTGHELTPVAQPSFDPLSSLRIFLHVQNRSKVKLRVSVQSVKLQYSF